MGKLIDGQWSNIGYETEKSDGKFVRESSQFRHWVNAGQNAEFPAQADRYHLYLSYACPWACRTFIFRQIKQLQDIIPISIVDPLMAEHGWVFSNGPGCIPDTVNGARYLYQIYTHADSNYTGRVTVPVLWDKHKGTIVNNESADIIRMLNQSFNSFTSVTTDYYPPELAEQINSINEKIYHTVNNGVYKCGFATSQQAYEQAFDTLFTTLDELEILLSEQPYLVGTHITEADWRLFTTLIRFDPVYVGHFKCNKKRIADYPALYQYLCRLYHFPGIAETVNLDHIKQHYYKSHKNINPTGIVPKGPEISLS